MEIIIQYDDPLFDSKIVLRYTDVIDVCIGHEYHVILFTESSKKPPIILKNESILSLELEKPDYA